MRRVDMTGLPQRSRSHIRGNSVEISASVRARYHSSATCAAAAVAPRRPRAHGGRHSRCEQAQSSGRPIVCEPSSSTAPTAWEGRCHTRKHAHADSAEDSWKSKDGGVLRAIGRTPGFRIQGRYNKKTTDERVRKKTALSCSLSPLFYLRCCYQVSNFFLTSIRL